MMKWVIWIDTFTKELKWSEYDRRAGWQDGHFAGGKPFAAGFEQV